MSRLSFSVAILIVAGFALLLHGQATRPADEAQGAKTVTPSGLTIVTIQAGGGAQDGDVVFVHYSGRLEDGTQFDSSYERGEPISLILGSGQVIRGWEEGLRGMSVGEKRRLIIPPDLAYGAEGRPPKIPQNATLTFELELMGIQRR